MKIAGQSVVAMLGFALASLAFSGCCHSSSVPTARVGTRWGMIAGNVSMAVLPKPAGADPIAAPSGADQCFSDADLIAHFGPTCGSHEASAAGVPSNDGDFGHPTPTTNEERWYCACPIVARVVVERCAAQSGTGQTSATNTFRVLQIALVTKDGCS